MLNDLRATSSQCNDKILTLSTSQQQAQANIARLNQLLTDANAKLSDFTPALNGLISKRNELVSSRDSIEK